MSLIRVLVTPLPCRFILVKKKKNMARQMTYFITWDDWSVFDPRFTKYRAMGILYNIPFPVGESVDTCEQEIALTSQIILWWTYLATSFIIFLPTISSLSFVNWVLYSSSCNQWTPFSYFSTSSWRKEANLQISIIKMGKRKKTVHQRMKRKESFPLPEKQICFASNSMHANFQQ